MIAIEIDSRQFIKDMNNAVAYSNGFLDGAKLAKSQLSTMLGIELRTLVAEFIDSNARVDPASLHHVYEWYQTGSPASRLFDIDYKVIAGGLTMYGTLTQSRSIANGSKTPFYDKARVMEAGIPVTISPKQSSVLAFEQDGETVFTKKPVTVSNPGGSQVAGSFEQTFRSFFLTYASQSLLDISGLGNQIRNSKEYDKSFSAGVKSGRSVGLSAGKKHITGGKF